MLIKSYPETHQSGHISIENVPAGLENKPVPWYIPNGDLGIQIASDGRVWVCINGIAFLRFKPDNRKTEVKDG